MPITQRCMENIIHEAARRLVRCYNGQSALRFPPYRKGTIRVSEQEARVVLTDIFMNMRIPFAVEVPTETEISQTGNTPMSGRHDVATYQSEQPDAGRDWIFELKAHNCEERNIRKDLEKMLLSGHNCCWFHVLRNENRRTCQALLEKFETATAKLNVKLKSAGEGKAACPADETRWIIALAVLEPAILHTKTVCFRGGELEPFFQFHDFEHLPL